MNVLYNTGTGTASDDVTTSTDNPTEILVEQMMLKVIMVKKAAQQNEDKFI